MNTTRVALRASTALRSSRITAQRRLQSTAPAQSQSHATTALYGGLAGGAFAVLIGYGFYSYSGVKTAVQAANQAKSYVKAGKEKLKQAAPEPNEALEWLRKQTYFYASFVPGGRQYVDTVFQDFETIRQKHGPEVDKIVQEAYGELKDVTSSDLSLNTATQAWEILQKHVKRIGELAGDSAKDILNNHPQLKNAVGSNIDQLKSLGDSLGPEANKLVGDTWSQVQGIIAGGLSVANIDKIKKLIQEKTEQVKSLGDKAWSKGYDELKPLLEKNPQIRDLLDKNKSDLLSSGSELWSKAKEATQSGNIDNFEQYVKQTVDKAKQSGGGSFEKYINQVLPDSAGKLIPRFDEFKEMAKNTDTEGLEKLLKETVGELEVLLKKKLDEGRKLVGDKSK